MSDTSAPDTTVLVVGAGPAGLSMAILLGRLGLDTIVVERRSGVNPHPRARSVNVRTAELFRQWGLLDEIEAVSLPVAWTEQFVYCETLAGAEIGRVTTGVQPVVDGVEFSPAPWLLTSQDRIEEVLVRHLGDHPSVQVRWNTEILELTLSADQAAARVRTPHGTRHITARWIVGADGAASTVRRSCGIEMAGRANLATLINCQFYADLAPWTDHRPAALYWTTHPARNVFQKIDADDRWLCQIGYNPRTHHPDDFTPTTAAQWIRRSIGVADLDLDVTDVIPWVMSSTVAEKFTDGRVFLVGDAAHQLPPTGGFGMNTAVQDAHNLAWKLAAVAAGHAGDGLLDTFETERAPIATYNAARSLENARSVGRIRGVIEAGDSTAEQRRQALLASSRYGNWLGMDLGLHYADGCLIPDGTEAPQVDDPVSDYAPTARPGHRAPHVAIDLDGATSTLDLYDEQFVLLCGADASVADSAPVGSDGAQAGHDSLAATDGADADTDGCGPAASTHSMLRVLRLGGDLADPDDQLANAHGIGRHGAVLIRPDGHVAWRHTHPTGTDATDALNTLLTKQ